MKITAYFYVFNQRGQLKRPDHADLRYKCRTYARLLQHLKVKLLKRICSMIAFIASCTNLSFSFYYL